MIFVKIKNNRNKIIGEILVNISTIIISLILAIFVISNIGGILGVKESSMEPTLKDGDRLVLNRYVYRFSEPNRGDIIILNRKNKYDNIFKNIKYEIEEIIGAISYDLNKSERKDNLVKRVIGIPGDEIYISNGKVYINGIEEDYDLPGYTLDYENIGKTIKVPENKYYVLGDNRERSLDSRELGYIDILEIKGKVKYRIWPLEKIGKI